MDTARLLRLDETTGKEQVYLLWLWLETLRTYSFERQPQGGDKQIGNIGELGATSLLRTMTNMSLEFPLLTYAEAYQLTWVTRNSTCKETYDVLILNS